MKKITVTEQMDEFMAYGSKCDKLSLDKDGNVVVEHVSLVEVSEDDRNFRFFRSEGTEYVRKNWRSWWNRILRGEEVDPKKRR